MNYLERLIFARIADTPPMLPAKGPRIQPPIPPAVRLRTPNAAPLARSRSAGMPAAARRALKHRNPRGATPNPRAIRFVEGS